MTRATLREAEENFARSQELFRRGAGTEKQRDEAVAARDQAAAGVRVAEAEIAGARLNLGYTEVHAPAAGIAALQSPSIGTLIQAQQTLLTTITPLDPAYVGFSFTDAEGQAFRALNARRAQPIDFLRQARTTATDPFSGGRNFVNHPAIPAWNVVPTTSTIETQHAVAPGTAWIQRRHGGRGVTIVNGSAMMAKKGVVDMNAW